MALRDEKEYASIPEFIETKFKEHNISKINLQQSIPYAICSSAYVGGYRKHYEIFDDTLIILDSICFDNILEYYKYLSSEDKERHQKQYNIRIKSENVA